MTGGFGPSRVELCVIPTSVGERRVGVFGEEALAYQVAAEGGEIDREAGLGGWGPGRGTEYCGCGSVGGMMVDAGARDGDGSMVSEVGQGAADCQAGESREQVGVTGWQAVGVLAEELRAEGGQVSGLAGRAGFVEDAK